MLKKIGRTPKSYAENLKNSEGSIYLCADCDKVIRESMHSTESCPFCNGNNVVECVLKIVQESEDDVKGKNQHT